MGLKVQKIPRREEGAETKGGGKEILGKQGRDPVAGNQGAIIQWGFQGGRTKEAARGWGGEKQSESAGGPRGGGSRQISLHPAPRGRDVAPHRQGGVGEVRGGIFALPALRHGHSRVTPGRGRPLLRGPARSGFGARPDATVYTGIPETGSPAPIGWRATPIGGSEQRGPLDLQAAEAVPRHSFL